MVVIYKILGFWTESIYINLLIFTFLISWVGLIYLKRYLSKMIEIKDVDSYSIADLGDGITTLYIIMCSSVLLIVYVTIKYLFHV